MSSVAVTTYAVECDGCAVRFGEKAGYRSAMDLRAAAYSAGWRFPALLKKNGQPSTGGSATVSSDVCPDCHPTWQPRYRGQSTPATYEKLNGERGLR